MENLLSRISIQVNEKLYLKDPESSELGRKIVSGGITLIDKIGFDEFTFRKLGQKINSPEASVYRYFENKHMFLVYLTSWYWSWMEYCLVMKLSNIASAEKRLELALELITEVQPRGKKAGAIEVDKLGRIVIAESSKSYLSKEVDRINKEGAFLAYKQFVARVSAIVSEIAPHYKYPNMLISTMVEGAHHQYFFAEHLPALSNKQQKQDFVTRFCTDLVFKTIKPPR